MTNLDTMIAPRALLAREIAEVAAPQLIIYGVAHRAFTHASLWDGPDRDSATTSAAESVLGDIASAALTSVKQWLGDCQTDGEPRFYQQAGLTNAVSRLLAATGSYFSALADAKSVDDVVALIEDCDAPCLSMLIQKASA